MKKGKGLMSVTIPEGQLAPPDGDGSPTTPAAPTVARSRNRRRPAFNIDLSYIPNPVAHNSAVDKIIAATGRMGISTGAKTGKIQSKYTLNARPPTPYYREKVGGYIEEDYEPIE